ncbi:conjugative transposon protein TraM [Salegentibacter sp. Hel_I_6]|uniref:conjugative transposon protein TraM n=1 Tax=Salegentibacter sp. Hel_I_6 TaxID=1250278 RepID=UPI0005649813|nr:conjugative transposon protein TraM [Salegentibacter sp. Hel_I_6]
MKENKKKSIRITEGSPNETAGVLLNHTQEKVEKLRKLLIFILMGVVFIGCMYLIFKPSSTKENIEKTGLNKAVPQATNEGLPTDKGKAYQQEILQKKVQEKRDVMRSLSDYWNSEVEKETPEMDQEERRTTRYGTKKDNQALSSYRNAQRTLNSFYEDNDHQTHKLQKQIEELKEQLAEKEAPQHHSVEEQLTLMEESYKMAAKYLPTSTQANQGTEPSGTNQGIPVSSSTPQEYFVAFTPARKSPVSTLYRKASDSISMDYRPEHSKRGFYTAGLSEELVYPKNSIKAYIAESQTVIGETRVRLRLMDLAKTPNRTIPQGTMLTANAKFQGTRLQLKVTSIELQGNIIPVDISIYDLDGQQGLYVPYSPEISAFSEMVGNMGQTSATSLMLSQSAGQQITADLGRGAMQGVSGYFSKKVKTPKVTLKAGYQVLLVSKNKY